MITKRVPVVPNAVRFDIGVESGARHKLFLGTTISGLKSI